MTEIEVSTSGTVTADVGDVVVIRLPENSTTGYAWSVIADGLDVVRNEFVPIGGSVGAAGQRQIDLRVVKNGAADVVLRLERPWEDRPVDERRITVRA
jgi:predicted secreted protein